MDWKKVYKYLEGTCLTPQQAIDYFNLKCTPEDVENAMLDLNLEQCPNCGWWVESWELTDENGEPKFCDNCTPL